MTKKLFSLFIMFCMSMVFLSCSNDKDSEDSQTENGQNELKLGDLHAVLSKAYLDREENRESESEFVLYLLSTDATVSFKQDGHIDMVNSDKGSGLAIELNSIGGSNVTVGDYFYKAKATESFTFDYSDGAFKLNQPEEKVFSIRGGKFTVLENNDNYEFTFEMETNLGETVKGHYKGKVTKIDF